MQQEIKEKMAVWDNTSTVEFWAFVLFDSWHLSVLSVAIGGCL